MLVLGSFRVRVQCWYFRVRVKTQGLGLRRGDLGSLGFRLLCCIEISRGVHHTNHCLRMGLGLGLGSRVYLAMLVPGS